jgi:hypothetical protein
VVLDGAVLPCPARGRGSRVQSERTAAGNLRGLIFSP